MPPDFCGALLAEALAVGDDEVVLLSSGLPRPRKPPTLLPTPLAADLLVLAFVFFVSSFLPTPILPARPPKRLPPDFDLSSGLPEGGALP